MDTEHCTSCNEALEASQIGECDSCQEIRESNRPLTKDRFGQRFAIMAGSLAKGFSMADIVQGDEAVKEALQVEIAEGRIADAVPVGWPSDLEDNASDTKRMDGVTYLVFTTSAPVTGGVEIYGPFRNDDDAEDFGERNRSEDGEYEVMDVDSLTKMVDLLI